MIRVLAGYWVTTLVPAALCAQAVVPGPPVVLSRDTAIVRPKRQYPAGALKRFFLGDLNRELWDTEFPVPVLDLQGFAGGLTPLARGGGLQTQSLRFRGGDDQVYNFRSIDKDATRAMDPEIARTIVGEVRQDQIAALFPLSAMVVAPLLRAAGVLHADPALVILPDDSRLGEFREEFAGALGWIEVRPDDGPDGEPGFAGAARVSGSARLLERLEEDPGHKVNVTSFLRARLMDVYVGDWDRHPDQWRWAAFEFEDSTVWEPIPRDRDWALARLDGLLVYVAGWIFPNYKGFGSEYPSMYRATWAGRALDRHILSALSREEFLRVATDVQARLTDEVIEETVANLPVGYRERVGAELVDAFTRRRDGFVAMAVEYYDLLAKWVDVSGSDRRDLGLVERLEGDRVRIELFRVRQGEPEPNPYFSRVFLGGETREVRLFLRGNDDRAEVTGRAPSTITVRVDGGGADDIFVNESIGGKTYFYDHRGDNEFVMTAARTRVDEDDFEEPFDPAETTHQAKYRDWGHSWVPYPTVDYDSDEGYYIGAVAKRNEFGFRYFPWESQLSLSGAIGGRGDRGRIHAGYDAPILRRRARLRLQGHAHYREVARFFGFGNDTRVGAEDDLFKFDRSRIDLSAEVAYHMFGSDVEATLGGSILHYRAETGDAAVVESIAPYGFPDFTQFRMQAGLTRDTRDRAVATTGGALLSIAATLVPGVLESAESYGSLSGRAHRYWSAEGGGQPTLALRAGATRVFGEAPYHDGAVLGGSRTVLGVRSGRYTGDTEIDASLLGTLKLFDASLIVPAEVGILGVAGAGRVWLDGESPGGWHEGYGGGIWLSFLQRPLMASFTAAGGDEEVRYYFNVGLPF